MSRMISAREAIVKTATIQVKALTLDRKQVTLAVFRQLKNEPLLESNTAELRGVPWGTVNYFADDCKKASEHLHVVWQTGDELRRSCVWNKPQEQSGYANRLYELKDAVSDWIVGGTLHGRLFTATKFSGQEREYGDADLWLQGLHLKVEIPWECWQLQTWTHNKPWGVEFDADNPETAEEIAKYTEVLAAKKKADALEQEFRLRYGDPWSYTSKFLGEIKIEQERFRFAFNRHNQLQRELQEMLRERAQEAARLERIEALREWDDDDTDVATRWQRVAAARATLDAFTQAWRDQYEALEALDQLFIAV